MKTKLCTILYVAACLAIALPAWTPASAASADPTPAQNNPVIPVTADQAPGGSDLMPLRPRKGTYVIQAGDKPAQRFTFRLESTGADPWRLTIENKAVTFFQRTPEGAVLIPGEQDPHDKVAITYTPPLVMLPAHWPKSLVVESTVKMVVRNIKTGAIREKGVCIDRVEMKGRQHVATPAGQFDAYLVTETRHIRLQMAKVDVISDTWYVPGKGDVAEQTRQRTRVFGLFGDWHRETSQVAP